MDEIGSHRELHDQIRPESMDQRGDKGAAVLWIGIRELAPARVWLRLSDAYALVRLQTLQQPGVHGRLRADVIVDAERTCCRGSVPGGIDPRVIAAGSRGIHYAGYGQSEGVRGAHRPEVRNECQELGRAVDCETIALNGELLCLGLRRDEAETRQQ